MRVTTLSGKELQDVLDMFKAPSIDERRYLLQNEHPGWFN